MSYGVMLWYNYEGVFEILEFNLCDNYNEALEIKRKKLATYLVGYRVSWDYISEERHEKELLALNLTELENMADEAYANKELDYGVEIVNFKAFKGVKRGLKMGNFGYE